MDIWLQDNQKEHLSILDEFGTGKTWFTLHYAWTVLQTYKQAKQKSLPRPRIPVFILLRDFAKAVEVESLISDFFFRKHQIEIKGVFDAFLLLNKMGKVLLIFDGFDEMADIFHLVEPKNIECKRPQYGKNAWVTSYPAGIFI